MGSTWGSRSEEGIGDEWIDYRYEPPGGNPRERRASGSLGLALLHVIGRQAQGLHGNGEIYDFDRPCFGIVIPEGGPCLEMVIAEGSE